MRLECSRPKDAKASALLRRVVFAFEFCVFQKAVKIIPQFPRPLARIPLDPVEAPPILGEDCLETPQEFCEDLGRRKLFSGGFLRRSEEHTSELQSHHDLVCRL